ncbi:hypothetical protein CXF83_14940 [Shewanella sp. Choline-02u-19]|uniref:hypothetical protein n=1 Tax=unclassified Shewanella TaxID=196818 RepID=UPI000C32D2BB|nr:MULTISPECIES: hypothetical protein [unclassified Shewanella]PKH62574.1 hypothetical protein CXF84_00990 [Shewanella sp. Bg11-22]PKI27915.1 hypothetical protein CXF83_14940 [Shewanella sp. Choline-02u-19]
MTITRDNLKVFKPELLGSSDEAGGLRTKNAIESGKLNELFTAISDIDHAQSAIDIVKCYPALNTQDTATLLDAHVFVSEPPTDPLVSLMLVESKTLNDSDRMTDMKEVIESGVTKGQLIRDGGPGFLFNQNSFSADYLQSSTQFNGREYWKTTRLSPGSVIAISVEYPDNEVGEWPRKTHFCKVVSASSSSASFSGAVRFEPAIPFVTPEPNLSINGQNRCTKLRFVNSASPLLFHGVAKLTAAASGSTIAVTKTKESLLPAIITEVPKNGNTITGGSDEDGDPTVSKVFDKILTQPSIEGDYSYLFTTPDVLDDPDNLLAISLQPTASFRGSHYVQAITPGAGNMTVTLTSNAQTYITANVTLRYKSSYRYAIYRSSAAFPSDKQLTVGTVKGSVVFDDSNYPSQEIYEREGETTGKLYDGVELLATVDYLTGGITLHNVSRGTFTLTYAGLIESSSAVAAGDTTVSFVLSATQPRLDSFYLQVERISDRSVISASADSSGVVTGTGVSGTMVNGLVELTFTHAVDLTTLRYDITEQYRQLPPAEIYGLNPLRIPNEGVVDIFRQWGTVALQHSQYQPVLTPTVGQVKNIRVGARFADITDANGASLWTLTDEHFSLDKAAGTVTLNSDFPGFTAPFVLSDTIGELALVSVVSDAELVLSSKLTQEYPINSTVASVQILGDLHARVGPVRDMTAWSNNWEIDGSTATGNLNTVDFPIEVSNDTAVNEAWVLLFTSATAFRCIGQRIGQIAIGDTLNDFSPINPLTNSPFFIIRAGAFGGGWNAGEAVRFETIASAKPVMAIRTVQAGHSQVTTDKAVLSFRGNES